LVLTLFWLTAAAMAPVQAGNPTAPSREQMEGQMLATEMRTLQPASGATNNGFLEVRDHEGRRTRIPLVIETRVGDVNGWSTRYVTHPNPPAVPETLTILHYPGRSLAYVLEAGGKAGAEVLPAGQGFTPFAGSDFWLADLGLEFLHWPDQRILPGLGNTPPMTKGRPCKILESRNPAGGPYSRVVSWVDNEFKSLIRADAYDTGGKLLKQFSIGSFKKVDGVWLLKDMEMIDERRDTKTRLEFELKVAE